MEIPLQITSRDFELTDVMKNEIQEKAGKLDNLYDRIMRCRVVLESPKRHMREGKIYNVRIDITVPGAEIVVKREPNEDLYVAIRGAFDAACRKLEDFSKLQRGDVKQHEDAPRGLISTLFKDKGYGFLTTPDGREIYFHANSVVNRDFKQLNVGMEVRFAEEAGEKGPQASTVHVKG